jgi:hypothetical protein
VYNNNNNNNNNTASKPQTTINLKAQAIYRPTNNVEGKVCEDSGGKLLYDRRQVQNARQNKSP